MANGSSLARRLVKKAALGAVGFVLSRPRLDEFVRRQLYRFPGLSGRVRSAVTHSRRADGQTHCAPLSDEADLTDDARQVLRDLQRAMKRPRTP